MARTSEARHKLYWSLILFCLITLHGFSYGLPTPKNTSTDPTKGQGYVGLGPIQESDPGPVPGRKKDSGPSSKQPVVNELEDQEEGGPNGNRKIHKAGHTTRRINSSVQTGPCDLYPTDTDIYQKISKYVRDGAKLLEYELQFEEYDTNPLLVNMSNNYMSNRWARAYTTHGKTLLALSFNYKVLSLSMLSFGVEKIKVKMVDAPKWCFGKYDAEDKLHKIMDVVMSDFRLQFEERQWVGEFDYACHQVISDDDGVADFQYNCCERSKEGHHVYCTKDMSVKWIRVMFVLVVTLKIAAFLTGPVFLNRIVYSDSLRQADYIVKLKDQMRKTILVKKVKAPTESTVNDANEARDFCKFKHVVKNVTPERINYVTFKKLQLRIDHRTLMTESAVPVGLWLFIYKNLFKCQFLRWEPFYTCCKESIFGSWSKYFLWLKLRKHSDCNTSCRKYCSWSRIFNLLGGFLLLLAVPIPYYVRVAIYYAYEEKEVMNRKEAIKVLDLDYPWEHTLIHYVDPKHTLMVLLYITYSFSFVLLVAFRSCNASKFDPIAVGAVHDMRQVKRFECLRLMLAHLVLPFEKFGICGILVGFIYWPIIIPLCIALSIFYCVPTLYLLGRFLIHTRPVFLRTSPLPTSPTHFARHGKKHGTLSHGTTSFETCLLLESISPGNPHTKEENCFSCSISKQKCYTNFLSVIVGLLCSVFMLSVLILFADVLGFAVEVFVFTLMGAVVNASSAAKYLMLGFWIMIYCTSCFNNMYDQYLDLNEKLFNFIKDKLKEEIKDVTLLRDELQKNTAFKFFNHEDLKKLRDMEIEEELDSDIENEEDRDKIRQNYKGYGNENDSIEYVNQSLHWRVHSLILFIDSRDEPRIPKDLFHEICKIEAPGCPGPVHRSLMRAFRQLSYMVIFIIFVLITVMAFGDAYKISSTNQLLVTLAGGFLPFVIRFVIKPKTYSVDLNSYSFEGKIHQIIYKFQQAWPVYDLSFRVESTEVVPERPPPEEDGNEDGGPEDPAQRGVNPRGPGTGENRSNETTHVDLFITIRDDMDDNIHNEPGSFGSRGSLPPDHPGARTSPDDPAYGINNPTNANIPNPDRRWGGLSFQSSGTQTGVETPGRSRPPSYPSYSSTSTQVHTPPGVRPVDLTVDMVRGGFRVRNQTTQDGGSENGTTMWGRGSPYRRVPSVPSKDESSV